MTTLSLDGRTIALSMSPPNDLARLGYPIQEFHRLVFELAMQILRHQGRVLYGGHLFDDSLSVMMFEHLAAAYASGQSPASQGSVKPFINLIAPSQVAPTGFKRFVDVLESFDRFVELRIVVSSNTSYEAFTRHDRKNQRVKLCLVEKDGSTIEISSATELKKFAKENLESDPGAALTAMRQASEQFAAARIILGGKRGDLGVADNRDRFTGNLPGIYEEAIQSLHRVPVVILGAFGGAARDLAFDLGLLEPPDERTPYLGPVQPGKKEAADSLAKLQDPIPTDRLSDLERFAQRDDASLLARDVVRSLCNWLDHDAMIA